MDFSIPILLQIVGLVIAAQYLALPLAVFAQSKARCRIELSEIDVGHLLGKAGEELRRIHQALLEIGFAPYLASAVDMSHSSTQFVAYSCATRPTTATVAVARSSVSESVSLEFDQWSTDGSVVCLTNSPMPPMFPRWKRKTVFRLPGETDVVRMLDVFERAAATQRGHLVRRDRMTLAEIERFMNDEIAHLVRTGFYQPQCTDGMRRMTIAAAYLSSWKMFWPWKQLVLAREKRRTVDAAGHC